MARKRFNPAPGWPPPPTEDWLPPAGWTPDASWPPAPNGWRMLVDVDEAPAPEPGVLWSAVGKPVTGMGAGRYKLTAHYLFFEKGMLRTDAQQVPISAVLDVDVKQSMTQKARGVGNVVVHIQRPTQVEVVTMEDIPNFREGQRLINETSHAARAALLRANNTHHYEGGAFASPVPVGPAAPVSVVPPPVPPEAPDPITQLRQLAELRDAGILNEEEFAAKKAEILGRM